MAFDGVPWLVAGATHSADVARLVGFYAAGKDEGVAQPTDMQVLALAVPGNKVRITPGACAIINRTPGYPSQAYLAIAPSETEVSISATGSGSGRSDLIIARVEDPTLSGSEWNTPEDPTSGPYVFPRVISGVPSGTTTGDELGLGYTAIPLARVDLPPSTGTITQSMITDLRGFAGVSGGKRQEDVFRSVEITSDTSEDQTGVNSPEYWPNTARWDIQIPTWATEVQMRGEWVQVRQPGDQVVGTLWASIGDANQSNPDTLSIQPVRYDTPTIGGVTRATYVVRG